MKRSNESWSRRANGRSRMVAWLEREIFNWALLVSIKRCKWGLKQERRDPLGLGRGAGDSGVMIGNKYFSETSRGKGQVNPARSPGLDFC